MVRDRGGGRSTGPATWWWPRHERGPVGIGDFVGQHREVLMRACGSATSVAIIALNAAALIEMLLGRRSERFSAEGKTS